MKIRMKTNNIGGFKRVTSPPPHFSLVCIQVEHLTFAEIDEATRANLYGSVGWSIVGTILLIVAKEGSDPPCDACMTQNTHMP